MPALEKYFKILLWLIAIHSFVAGMLLIILDNEGIQFFGFKDGNSFFQVQGGVFHLVMCVAYIMAATDLTRSKRIIIFIIIAKFIATIYLLLYYFLSDQIITVLLSAIGDGLMGIMVLWFLVKIPDRYFKGGKA